MPRLSALDYALKLLGFRARTKQEIRQKLIAKKYPVEDIDDVLVRLEKAQLLDDVKFAANYVRDKLMISRRGPRRIYFELIKHGVDREVADQATKAIAKDDETTTATELLAARARQWITLDPIARYRRAIGLLSRRGFSSTVINQVVKDWARN